MHGYDTVALADCPSEYAVSNAVWHDVLLAQVTPLTAKVIVNPFDEKFEVADWIWVTVSV